MLKEKKIIQNNKLKSYLKSNNITKTNIKFATNNNKQAQKKAHYNNPLERDFLARKYCDKINKYINM